MAAVIGIDASSTRLAAVVLDGKTHSADGVHTAYLKLPSDIAAACQQAYWWGVGLERDWSPALVALEAPFFHRLHPSGAVGMCQVNGALLASFHKPPVSVQPSKWKKHVVGAGNASKDQITKWVKTNYHNVDFGNNQDLYDAFSVAIYGMHVLSLRDRIAVRK